MNTLQIVYRSGLRRGALPVAVVGAIAVVGGAWFADDAAQPAAADAAGALAPWLHVPAFVAAAACCAAAVETWPLLSRDRPGRDWVLRAAGPPLFGCGAAVAGALLALLTLLLPVAAAAGLVAPAARAHRTPGPVAGIVLAGPVGSLDFTLPGAGAPACELRLRPIALAPTDAAPVPTTVEVRVDGRLALAAPAVFAGDRQLVRVPLDGAATRVGLRRVGGNLPLVFPPGAVELVDPTPRNALVNGALAVATYVLPAATALALATLLAPLVALPIALVLVLAALLVQTLGDLGPTGFAVAQLLRGRWLPDESLFQRCVPSLGAGLLAMILAMTARWRWTR